MGIEYSTAKWLAPASFIYDFAAQQYGLNSTPSMKDINDRNTSFWSPQPYFIGAFFAPQQLFQLAWLYRLWKLDPNKPKERAELDQIVSFVPYYTLGNICIGTWMFFWNSEQLKLSNVFVMINSLSQLYFIFTKLGPMNTSSTSSILTHINAKTFAGIGVLDFVHNISVAYYKDALPSTAIKVITGAGFAGLAAGSDWIFGGCLVYDLIALSVGQATLNNPEWSKMLGGFAVATAGIVGLRNYFIPPYVKEPGQYKTVDTYLVDTPTTEKDPESALEKDKDTILAAIQAQLHTPQETTTTLDLQDHSPTQQVILLRHRIESEDALHSHRMTTLQKTLHSEHQRHSTHALTFRERLIDLSTKQRDRLRASPKKLSPTKTRAIMAKDGEQKGGRQQKGSHVARWLEGLVSVSSISGIRESSDGSSSVEVVAAKDAKGKGKGIRIVSDAVEETAAIVDGDVERNGGEIGTHG
ncbi:hypothetical protein E4T47_01308 [Aureobasidium subglaciale]|nr:hypothetical protein E4T47_01308 [Aureobasidium subglaciale]